MSYKETYTQAEITAFLNAKVGKTDSGVFQLIASKIGVNGNALATTALDWQNSLTLATAIPMFFRIVRNTGTFTLAIVKLIDSGNILAVTTALGISATDDFVMPVTGGLIKKSGNLSAQVTTINGSAATFDIYVYGIRI